MNAIIPLLISQSIIH